MVLNTLDTGSGPAVCILHGMLGQARNWGPIARLLEPRFRVLAMDLRNHGSSPRGESMDYPTLAADVADTLRERGVGEASVIGHSMGGKVAMTLALGNPELVRSLVIVDIAPVPYPPDNLPLIRALLALDLDRHTRRTGLDGALAPSVPDPRVRAFLLQGLVTAPDGKLAWRNDLRAIERSIDTLSGFQDPGPGARYDGPTLLVTGAESSYVRVEHLAGVRVLFPRLRHEVVAGAGHWVHADQPQVFSSLVGAFLS